MKKHTDKILFAVALVIFFGSLGYYVLKLQNIEQSRVSVADSDFSGGDVTVFDLARFTPAMVDWPAPLPQGEDGVSWKYDVFTSPKIWWNPKTREFQEEEVDTTPPPPFGVKLVDIKRPLYRLQLEAFFESPDLDPTKRKILFFDRDADVSFRMMVGDTNQELGVKVVSFDDKRIEDATGGIRRVPTAVVYDQNMKREFTLNTDEETYIEDQFIVEFQTSQPPYDGTTFELNQVGNTHEIGDDVFTLLEFSFDKQSASLEKGSPLLDEPQIRNLTAVGEISAPTPTDESGETDASDSTPTQLAPSVPSDGLFQ